jgi:DNA-3-methyladenine glycosylase
MYKLNLDFYQREDILIISQDLLGKVLCTNIGGKLTSGIIVETEAYAGIADKASHAFGNRRTKRNETMYASGGKAYVYLCYGIHHLFNIVTNKVDIPHAVLIRAIEPQDGLETMLRRRNKTKLQFALTAGPGSLTKALGITIENSGSSLMDNLIWVEDRNIQTNSQKICASTRVGVKYAGRDAYNPWRFRMENNPWVSPAY